MKTFVAAAVSGGVDSLTAAFLLKEQGFSVTGLHFVTGFESFDTGGPVGEKSASEKTGIRRLVDRAKEKMKPMSEKLGIPIQVLDLSRDFRNCVVENFIKTYKAGKTPNPCLVCNPSIKFGTLLKHAENLGAAFLATGHYARVRKGAENDFHLIKGVDSAKDQSYFLAFLNQEQLGRACFPLGERTKSEVKALAGKNGLFPATRGESQDICFIREKSYGDFLSRHFSPEPGPVVDVSGKVVGEHKGLHLFTIGQRRGINCPAAEPYYVVEIDVKNNRLVVGFKSEILGSGCFVESVNWIGRVPDAPFAAKTRVRYRGREADSIVTPIGNDRAAVRFEKPREALTPGQGAVFYIDDEVIGGGWISRADD